MVRQLRDLVQEQQSIQRLQLLVESLKWVKDLSYDHQLKLNKQRLDSMVFCFLWRLDQTADAHQSN